MVPSVALDEATKPQTEKQYHAKRPHRKSRTGCTSCKARKVKCDEGRPACRACTLRREQCVYARGSLPKTPPASQVVSRGQDSEASSYHNGLQVLNEPLFMSPDQDATDMKLLWFYTSFTSDTFSIYGHSAVDEILKVKVVQHAFQERFLMDTVLGLAAMHLRQLNQAASPSKEIVYRARAFQGYRKAVEEPRRESFPALMACSLFLCGLCSDQFRLDDATPLYILDWMTLWKGISLIIGMSTRESLFESGMVALFWRPPIDLEVTATYVPGNLLFMVNSMGEDDVESAHKTLYYNALRYLGSLYMELSKGFSPTLVLRIITLFTFLPPEFFQLAQARRPRALIIIAHWLTFVKTIDGIWWMEGISDREIYNISRVLDREWRPLLRVPMTAVCLTERAELGKLLLDNHSWIPPSPDSPEQAASPTPTDQVWTEDSGLPNPLPWGSYYRPVTRPSIKPSSPMAVDATTGREIMDVDQAPLAEEYFASLSTSHSPSTVSSSSPASVGYQDQFDI